MAGGESSPLSGEQRRALQVLGYLFLRMGHFARAKKLFAALLALDSGDVWTRRALAAAHLATGDGAAALEQLDLSMPGGPLPSRDAALYLLKARALWLAGRADEAKNAVNAYLSAGGGRL